MKTSRGFIYSENMANFYAYRIQFFKVMEHVYK